MGLFTRRNPRPSPAVAIEGFWHWWPQVSDDVLAAIDAEQEVELAAAIDSHVAAIHPGLVCEYRATDGPRARLTLSGEGDVELRRLTRLWLLVAPPPDGRWEYADAIVPTPMEWGIVLAAPGDSRRRGGPERVELPVADVRFLPHKTGFGLNVEVCHPAFDGLPEQVKQQAAYLFLAIPLGEDVVAMWIDRIDYAAKAPVRALTLEEFQPVVSQLVAEHSPAGEPGWAAAMVTARRRHRMVRCLRRLRPAHGPLFSRYALLLVPYRDMDRDGFPGPGSMPALYDLEDRLTDALGNTGMLVAVESSDGVRSFHFYVDPDSDAADRLATSIRTWNQGRVRLWLKHDPSWTRVSHLDRALAEGNVDVEQADAPDVAQASSELHWSRKVETVPEQRRFHMGQSPQRRASQHTDTAPAIEEFWQWWAEAAPGLAAAIPAGELADRAGEVGERVQAIDPGLTWEFGPGFAAQHQLVVTTEGDPSLRRIARRWLQAAPPADDTWEFYDMRQPNPMFGILGIDGAEIDLAEVRVQGVPSMTGLDVAVYHPAFATLDENVRMQVVFLCIDFALGEEAAEVWLDAVEALTDEPAESVPLGELPLLVNSVIQEHAPDGELGWAILEGETPQGPIMAMVMNRLTSALAPELDEHVAVQVRYSDTGEVGLPGPGSLDSLRDFEEHLSEIVGPSGMVVAIESGGGLRTLHFYVDSTTPAAAQIEAATSGWNQGPVKITAQLDPAWENVSQFRF